MEQHPVPQQISSYQFRLVGDMTFRQFLYLAGGAVLSLLFYSTKLPGVVKWPLVVLPFLAGVAFAFLPIEDRPLSVWIISFFKSIYSPTIFHWTKAGQDQKYYQDEPLASTPQQVETAQTTNENRIASAILKSAPPVPAFLSKFDDAEKLFLSKISSLFTPTTSGANQQQVVSATVATQSSFVAPMPKQEVAIPTVAPITVTLTTVTTPTIPVPTSTETTVVQPVVATPLSPPTYTPIPVVANAQEVQFSTETTPPIPPTQANTIVGQVMDQDGKIVEGAILEVKDIATGKSIRALKSNRLGHFIVVTPIPNGGYQLLTEKDDYEFAPVNFEAKGELIPSMAIRGKKLETPVVPTQ